MQEIISDLQLSVLHLQTYQAKLVEPMIASAEEMIVSFTLNHFVLVLFRYKNDLLLKAIAKSLEIGLRFNKSSFAEAIEDLIREVQEAEVFLKTNGTEGLKKVSRNIAN